MDIGKVTREETGTLRYLNGITYVSVLMYFTVYAL